MVVCSIVAFSWLVHLSSLDLDMGGSLRFGLLIDQMGYYSRIVVMYLDRLNTAVYLSIVTKRKSVTIDVTGWLESRLDPI